MIVLISAVHADITFLRLYETENGPAEPADVIETSEGGYAYLTCELNRSFLRTDEYGEVLVQSELLWDRCLCENQDAELVLASEYPFSSGSITITWADLMGNILRTREFNEFNDYDTVTPRCIIQTSDKGYAICGYIYSIYPWAEGFVLKLDSLENYEWDVVLQDASLYTITEDSDNCLIAGGSDSSEDYVIKFSQDGDIIWENTYPSSSTYSGTLGIVPTSSGYAFTSSSGRVVGISSSGSFEWQYEATLPEIGYYDICVSPNGDVVTCGFSYSSSMMGGGPGVLTRLSPDGNLVWENNYENFGLYNMYSTADSGFVSSGRYPDVEPYSAKLLLLKVDSEGNYVSTGIEEEPEWNNAQLFPVYPNPFSESATISYSLADPGAVSIAIFDVSGRLVSSPVDCISAAGTYSFAINDLPSGIYMVRMRVAGREQVQRFVVMNKGV
jgi:hypothetical protein